LILVAILPFFALDQEGSEMAFCYKCKSEVETKQKTGVLCAPCVRESYRKNKEAIRARAKTVRDNNKERYSRYGQEDYQKHKAKRKTCVAQYVDKNRDAIREKQREYYQSNKEARRAKIAEWQAKNPEKYKEIKRAGTLNRLALKKNAEGRHTIHDIKRIHNDQKGICNACSCDLIDGYHVDHIVPLARGGSNWPDNLQLLCPSCNTSKGAKTMEEFMKKKA
jgi:5-methylcytosine-specific restriction endonuclease McrA